MKKLMLIDGHSLMNRAFYAIPLLTNKDGIYTNAIHGFLNILFKHINIENPSQVAVTFDMSKPTFRHLTYSDYKGNRKKSQPEFSQQIPIIKEILVSMGIDVYEKAGFEADDILASIACINNKDMQVVVITGDRDLLQIVTDNIKVKMITSSKSKSNEKDYYKKDFIEEYGFDPVNLIDYKSLMGDSSDNIKGVPKIGEKTASKLIIEYTIVENVLENIENIRLKSKTIADNLEAYKEHVLINKQLVTILKEVDVQFEPKENNLNNVYNEDFFELCKKYDLKTYLTKFIDKNSNIYDNQDENNLDNLNKDNLKFRIIVKKDELKEYFELLIKDLNNKGLNNKDLNNNNNLVAYKMIYDNNKFLGISIATKIVDLNNKDLNNKDLNNKDLNNNNIQEIVFVKANFNSEITIENLQDNLTNINNLLTQDDILQTFKPFFEQKFENFKKITIDAKQDIVYLNKYNINLDYIDFDIMMSSYILNPVKNTYEYNDIAFDYLGKIYESKQDLLGKDKMKTKKFLFDIAEDKWLKYVCLQVHVCLEVMGLHAELIKKRNQENLFYNIEMPLIKVLSSMEIYGIKVSEKELNLFKDDLDSLLLDLTKEIYLLANKEFNINSPKQLAEILYDELGLVPNKNNKNNKSRSTSADILEKLSEEHEIINKILTYRTYAKLKTTYAEGLLSVTDKNTSRVYSTFKQTGTATGRLSSVEPNLQNIPIKIELGERIRKAFLPEDGFIFIDADYSQIELRVLAHLSQDENLVEAFNKNEDIHKMTASKIFNKNIDDVSLKERSTAKAINFGLIYGKQAFSLSQELEISKKQAEDYIKDYFDKYPKIKNFLDATVEETKQKGYTTTLYNRTRNVPEINSSSYMQRSIGERIAMNTPIQGTAADIIKIAMLKVYDKIKELNLKSRLLLQVHDELLIEAQKDEVEIINKILRDEMENAVEFSVKLAIDINKGDTWYDAK